ncbi:MAG: hypothetical protein ACLR6J_18590 [Parabacteroides merdae]
MRPGWAEQNPDDWWMYLKEAIKGAIAKAGIKGTEIDAIGILAPDAWARIGGQEDAGAASGRRSGATEVVCGAYGDQRQSMIGEKQCSGTSFEFSRKPLRSPNRHG